MCRMNLDLLQHLLLLTPGSMDLCSVTPRFALFFKGLFLDVKPPLPQEIRRRGTQLREIARVEASTQENIGHFVENLKAIYEKYRITRPEQVGNIDETGFDLDSIPSKSYGSSTADTIAIVSSGQYPSILRGNIIPDRHVLGNRQHVTATYCIMGDQLVQPSLLRAILTSLLSFSCSKPMTCPNMSARS